MFSGNTSQVSDDKLFVEDVFSTWLYTGTGAAQTITNGIDLAGKGGLVWTKSRSSSIYNNTLVDTARGGNVYVSSNTTNANISGTWLTFNSDGYGVATTNNYWNANGGNYASWTFREAPKFFDVVTYTGTGANRTIAHNLGVAPGCILVKRTDTTADWQVYHRSNANTEYMVLNTTAAKATGTTRWNSTTPTATEFTVGTDATVNASGGTYVAYLFAHDTTSDGVIQCGSFTATNGSSSTVNLGWEPQWLMMKISSSSGDDWKIFDNMRGLNAPTQNAALLKPNTSEQEYAGAFPVYATSTGFTTGTSLPNATFVYIAIRRGPMKTPTLGTSVFSPVTQSGGGTITTNFPVDLILTAQNTLTGDKYSFDRLRGSVSSSSRYLVTNKTDAEVSVGAGFGLDNNVGYRDNGIFSPSYPAIYWNFRRAPGFFDEVCYTGTGAAGTITHNLGVVPELMIVKSRNLAGGYWAVYANALGNSKTLYLNLADAPYTSSEWNNTSPTSTVYSVSGNGNVNGGGYTYVAYLFASCPGVSKVGSYTGNGSSQTINCGFAAGARFVMIKRTNATGDWYVWDTARGIVAGNDPHLSLNTTAAEVTTDDTIDTDSSGFVVNQVAATNVNVSSATYIYLAIA